MKKRSIPIFLLFCLISFGQNKLDKSKSELKSSSNNKKQKSLTSSNTSASSKSESSSGDNIIGRAVADVFIYATYGVFKYVVIGDYRKESHLHNSLTPNPFYDGISGNFQNADTVLLSKKTARLDIEDGFVYKDNNLFGNHFKTKIRPFQYFYLQTDFHQLFEINKIDNTNNRLSLFQFNLNYDRIRFEKFNFGWNLGVIYVGNEVKKAGFAYGLNAEYFIKNHISFLGSAKWSRINDLSFNAFELQSKFHKKNYFFSLGFEHLKIATPTYNFVALGGGIYF